MSAREREPRYVIREPRERPFRIAMPDLEDLTLPAIIVGGLVGVAYFKDDLAKIISEINIGGFKLPEIPGVDPKGGDKPGLPSIPDIWGEIIGQITGGDGGGNGGGTTNGGGSTGGGTTGGGTTGGGGGTSTGSTWYKANGSTKSMPNARCDGASNRWENEVNWGGLPGYEVVVYFTIPKGQMKAGENAGHIGLKHGGPNHTSPCDFKVSGDCCCWWDTGLRQTGTVYTEVEHPHPSNIHTKKYGNIGRTIDGPPLGIRWHIMKEGGNVRLKQWVDTSGQVGANKWKQTYDVLDTFNGSLMPSDYKSKAFTNKQNIEIRISDTPCKSIKMNYGPISRQITSSAHLAYAHTSYLPLERVTIS